MKQYDTLTFAEKLIFEAVAWIVMVAAVLIIALCSGCAALHSRTESVDGSHTSVTVYTLFDSQSQLTKFRNASSTTSNNQWSAGSSISALNQSSESTNLNAIIESVASGIVKGLKP
jgi:hypothetical protein